MDYEERGIAVPYSWLSIFVMLGVICAIRFVSKSVRKSQFLWVGHPGSMNRFEGPVATQTERLGRIEPNRTPVALAILITPYQPSFLRKPVSLIKTTLLQRRPGFSF